MKAKRSEEAAQEKFEASRSWFRRFKEKKNNSIKSASEEVCAEAEAPASYPENLVK
jgi:hypothetical protein